MKTPNKGVRVPQNDTDEMRKAKKLAPMRKSGKERHSLYHDLDNDDEEEDYTYNRRESAYDYMDDEEEEA